MLFTELVRGLYLMVIYGNDAKVIFGNYILRINSGGSRQRRLPSSSGHHTLKLKLPDSGFFTKNEFIIEGRPDSTHLRRWLPTLLACVRPPPALEVNFTKFSSNPPLPRFPSSRLVLNAHQIDNWKDEENSGKVN